MKRFPWERRTYSRRKDDQNAAGREAQPERGAHGTPEPAASSGTLSVWERCCLLERENAELRRALTEIRDECFSGAAYDIAKAALASKANTVPYSVEDGYGNGWECPKALPEGQCGLEVVRPGKVQCDVCNSTDNRAAPSTRARGEESMPKKERE